MELENRTEFPARLLVADLGETEVRAVVIVKATYDLGPTNQLKPAPESLPILGDPLVTPYGVFHGDHLFLKEGADFCVLGTVRRARPVTETYAAARIGRHGHRLRVLGNRHWRQDPLGGSRLVASAPEPFTEMPVSYTRAFGGKAEFNYEPAPWPDNPDGVGYYLTREQALGRPLPNIEPANGPFVQSWEDRPPVAGWGPYPMFWGMRGTQAVEVDAERFVVQSVSPKLFNNAHPALVVRAIQPGDSVSIEGLGETALRFNLPMDRVEVTVKVGTASFEVAGRLDGVFVWVDASKVVITQRARFRYAIRPREIRRATVSMRASDAAAEGRRER